MQIRLTVLGPRSGRAARGFDVLITAPAGTALGAVAGALASAAGSGQPGGRSSAASVVLYAGPQRLAPTAVLGVPPLVDGALVSLQGPPDQHGDHGQYGTYGQYGLPTAEVARLRVVGGPDAGGVHLLPGGQARIGRSSEADVPLDDPDVSRLHCEVAVGADGEVTVMDLGSTNGTSVAGRPVGPRPAPLPPGALLRIGESTLRLDGAHTPAPAPLPSVPDSDGHLRVALREEQPPAAPAPAPPLPRPRGADPYDQHAEPGQGPAPYDQHAAANAIPGQATGAGHPQHAGSTGLPTAHTDDGVAVAGARPAETGMETGTGKAQSAAHARPGNAPAAAGYPRRASADESGTNRTRPGHPGTESDQPAQPGHAPAEPGRTGTGGYTQPGMADQTGTGSNQPRPGAANPKNSGHAQPGVSAQTPEGSPYTQPTSGPGQPGHATAGTDATHGGNAGHYTHPGTASRTGTGAASPEGSQYAQPSGGPAQPGNAPAAPGHPASDRYTHPDTASRTSAASSEDSQYAQPATRPEQPGHAPAEPGQPGTRGYPQPGIADQTGTGSNQPRPGAANPESSGYAQPGVSAQTGTGQPHTGHPATPPAAPGHSASDRYTQPGTTGRTSAASSEDSQYAQPATGPGQPGHAPAEPGQPGTGGYAQPGVSGQSRTGTGAPGPEGSPYAQPLSGPGQPGHVAGTGATHGGNAGGGRAGQRQPGDTGPEGRRYAQQPGHSAGASGPAGHDLPQQARPGRPGGSAAQPGGQGRVGAAAGELSGQRESARRATGERRGIGKARDGDAERGGLVGSIGAWARRRLSGGGGVGGGGSSPGGGAGDAGEAEALRERWPDPAAVLLTALGPGRRLWERGPAHPDVLTVRLGTAGLPSRDGSRLLDAVPFTVDLRAPGTSALTLAGPRPRLAGLARAVLAQLAALHSPATLEIVLLSADRARAADRRAEEWSWLNWLPHLRPGHGQDCRLLLAFDRDQVEARTAELVRRLEAGPLGAGWATAPADAVAAAAAGHEGPFTVLVADGDPGSAGLRETVARIALAGPSVGVHVLCLAEAGERPVIEDGVTAWLSGDVATTLRIESAQGPSAQGPSAAGTDAGADPRVPDDIVLDAVSAAWAEHFARALAPLREADAESSGTRWRHALPGSVRLLEELDLALATPAKVAARWADASAAAPSATVVLGTGAAGRVVVDLVTEGPHTLIGGAAGAGKTELLRSVAAALAAGERPDRLALVLVDGAGQERGEGLLTSADLPHVETHLVASDPVRMREFAQGLTAELKRRAEVLGGQPFGAWHALRAAAPAAPAVPAVPSAPTVPAQGGPGGRTARAAAPGPTTGESGKDKGQDQVLPRLVVVVDDFDELVAPGLGSPGRPAAGSVVRALEAVAREGERLGVHLVATTGRPERTAGTELDERAALRIALRMADPESAALVVHVEDPAGLDDAVPGRGYVRRPGGGVTAFQAGRVSGRIPRTATLRPTVVAVEWERMGDPPARRQVRELGNGPTDLALLASALQRAAAPPAAALDVSDPPRP